MIVQIEHIDDPTKPWPLTRRSVLMGTLYLTNVADNQETASEKIAFNPCRLVTGLDLSDDPILKARKGAYDVSRDMRGGSKCPFNSEIDNV